MAFDRVQAFFEVSEIPQTDCLECSVSLLLKFDDKPTLSADPVTQRNGCDGEKATQLISASCAFTFWCGWVASRVSQLRVVSEGS